MTTIDVRKQPQRDEVTRIDFADSHRSYNTATHITQDNTDGAEGFIAIFDANGDYVNITSVEDAKNLTRALIKAVELGWLK